jgi:hypothetical protein
LSCGTNGFERGRHHAQALDARIEINMVKLESVHLLKNGAGAVAEIGKGVQFDSIQQTRVTGKQATVIILQLDYGKDGDSRVSPKDIQGRI